MAMEVRSRAAVRQHTTRTQPALPLQLAMPAAVERCLFSVLFYLLCLFFLVL